MMKEGDIRPKHIFDNFKTLCEQDSREIFKNCIRKSISCPACSCTKTKSSFPKDGFNYQICSNCNTIYLNPRPSFEIFQKYYTEGKSVKYYSTNFYPKVEIQRKEKIYRPNVLKIKKKLDMSGVKTPLKMVDIGSGYGSFLEMAKELKLSLSPEGIELNKDLATICQQKGFICHETSLEKVTNLNEQFNLAVSFEVLEHLYDPKDFICKAYNLLEPDGILLMTSLSGTGYDFQLLGHNHDNLKPPHHINFFNPLSAYILYKTSGFKYVEIETPGKLDIDILCNRVEDFPYILEDTVFSAIYNGDNLLKEEFQKFIVKNKLSSHMWIWAYK